jgi:hypothetical protein
MQYALVRSCHVDIAEVLQQRKLDGKWEFWAEARNERARMCERRGRHVTRSFCRQFLVILPLLLSAY